MGRAQVDVIVWNLYRQRIRLHGNSVRCDFKDGCSSPVLGAPKSKENQWQRTHASTARKKCGRVGGKNLSGWKWLRVTSRQFLYLFFVSASHHLKGNTNEQTNLLRNSIHFVFIYFFIRQILFSIVIVFESSGAAIRFHSVRSRSKGDNELRRIIQSEPTEDGHLPKTKINARENCIFHWIRHPEPILNLNSYFPVDYLL